jgi:uncharacterized protein (TIGR02246 family)
MQSQPEVTMSTMQHPDDPRFAIDALNRAFMDAFIRKDSAAIAFLYTSDGQLFPPRSEPVSGKAAIKHYWQAMMEIGVRKLTTTELNVYGEAAHEVGRYAIEMPDGDEASSGSYIVIWKREAGEWRMHRDIWNDR